MTKFPKIVALAGGVGGAKLADGISRLISPEPLTIIVNTGDDMELFGLHISPDLDTVMYTLAAIANPETGWGRKNETWNVLKTLHGLSAPDWFQLGDRDLALHMARTQLLNQGKSLTDVEEYFCEKLGVKDRVLPMSDQSIQTIVKTQNGRSMAFQEYFVKEQCKPVVNGFEFKGIKNAQPSQQVINATNEAELIVICPSNPWVSIDPIISLPGILHLMEKKNVVAVSPIIGGKTVKGPAAKMFAEMGINPCVKAVADHYAGFLNGLVLDVVDENEADAINSRGIIPFVTNTIMKSTADRIKLAEETINFGMSLAR